MIIARLQQLQHHLGFLPDADLRALARELGVPLSRVEEVASYYPVFRREWDRPARVEVRVCRDATCHLRGAAALLGEDGLPGLAAELAQASGGSIRVEGVSCLGRCDRAPVLWVEHLPRRGDGSPRLYCGRSQSQIARVLSALAAGQDPAPDTDAEHRVVTNAAPATGARPGRPPHLAWEINPYGGDPAPAYEAVRRLVQSIGEPGARTAPSREWPEPDLRRHIEERHPFLEELRVSGLAGMGGAGAATYGKWLDVWLQPGPEKYIVANGDESEPGTFKDRELLMRFPHLVVEGVILAGLTTGASAGFIYIRHEYHEQVRAVRAEIERAAGLTACGDNVFGSGRSFPVEVFESPGGYICGEQSALLEAMEDRRAQPRNRPPELGTNGLRDRPTVVNNVETLAWAPYIYLRGGAAYASAGWQVPGSEGRLAFAGRRLISVSGDVARRGVFEVPIGLPLRDLLLGPEYGGGINGRKNLLAVAMSGPSGGLLPARLPVPADLQKHLPAALKRIRDRSPNDADLMEWFVGRHLPPGATHLELLDVPLDLPFVRNLAGVLRLEVEPTLGAGIVVYAEGRDVLDHAVNFTRFFRNESCGKCVPCRLGSQKLYQLGTDLIARRDRGAVSADEVRSLRSDVLEVSRAMQQTSICGLGYVAPVPLGCALTYFADGVVQRPEASRPPA